MAISAGAGRAGTVPMADPLRVLLVDDHPVVRDGLSGQLQAAPDIAVVAGAGSSREALAVLHRQAVDVVVTDLRMPGIDGIDLIGRIRHRHPDVEVLVLTTYDSREDIAASFSAGARGYLLKDTGRAELLDAVRATARGRRTLSPGVRLRMDAPTDPVPVLSDREHEVLGLVAAGHTNSQIGAALFVGESTVKTHLQHVFDKLGARDRAAAVSIAYQRRLL